MVNPPDKSQATPQESGKPSPERLGDASARRGPGSRRRGSSTRAERPQVASRAAPGDPAASRGLGAGVDAGAGPSLVPFAPPPPRGGPTPLGPALGYLHGDGRHAALRPALGCSADLLGLLPDRSGRGRGLAAAQCSGRVRPAPAPRGPGDAESAPAALADPRERSPRPGAQGRAPPAGGAIPWVGGGGTG